MNAKQRRNERRILLKTFRYTEKKSNFTGKDKSWYDEMLAQAKRLILRAQRGESKIEHVTVAV